MKTVMLILLSFLFVSNSFAATASCKKMASERANAQLEKRVADDCFQEYLQEAKDDKNIIYVGFRCDHVGKYQYKIVTQPSGADCKVLKVTSKSSE